LLLIIARKADAARSQADVIRSARKRSKKLKQRRVILVATEQPIDTLTAAGKEFLNMLGAFAEFETNLHRERQLEGIALAKARGAYKGREPSIDGDEVRGLRDEEKLGPTAIARGLKIGRASVYRVLATANP
jgi:DNA invertase Pin-like site-specific DNA recombinase